MERRIKIGLAFLLVGAAVVGGWSVLSTRLHTSREGFGIYLLDNNELVVSDKDIVSYNKTCHEIKLTEEGVRKIGALSFEVPVYGKPFVVKLNDREMYNGSFWSSFSSVSCSGVVIVDVLAVRDGVTDTVRIEAGYPSSEFFKGVDPRNNLEILDHFQRVGKLTH